MSTKTQTTTTHYHIQKKRRKEFIEERAGSLGAGFTADRLTIEYALQGFGEGHRAHRVTIRWR